MGCRKALSLAYMATCILFCTTQIRFWSNKIKLKIRYGSVKVPLKLDFPWIDSGSVNRSELLETQFGWGPKEPEFWVQFGVRPKCLGSFVRYKFVYRI